MPHESSPLRILQFCNKAPYPPVDGGAIGMHNVSQGLLDAGQSLKILSFNSSKHHIEVADLPLSYREETSFEAVEVDLNIRPVAALINLFYSKKSYNISRFLKRNMILKLEEILKNNIFDIIQVESVFLKDYLPIIRKYSKAKVVLRAPNVEFIIWQRLAQIENKPFKRFYLSVLANRLKREELSALNRFDAIYTVTENDLKLMRTLGAKVPMISVPTGVDVTKDLNTKDFLVDYPSLFHLGALDWYPNQEAIKWILNNVWPKLHQNYPGLKFYIAGRRPPRWLMNMNSEGVVMLGEVKDAAAFIKSKAIMPVPLFSGSGMRVKIVEAMMLEKAIVSTSIGIEGIQHTHGKDVLIANSADEFITQISRLLDDKHLFNSICSQAKINVSQQFSNEVLTAKLIRFFRSL